MRIALQTSYSIDVVIHREEGNEKRLAPTQRIIVLVNIIG